MQTRPLAAPCTPTIHQVTVTDGGVVQPTHVTQLWQYYGSVYAISFTPQGWATKVGHTYHVNISGVSPGIAYNVMPVTCT